MIPALALLASSTATISADVRALLNRMSPELVAAAEGFAQDVVYIPVSSLGRAPTVDSVTGLLGIRPRDLQPLWTEVPFLYALARWTGGIIPYKKAQAESGTQEQSSTTPWPPTIKNLRWGT